MKLRVRTFAGDLWGSPGCLVAFSSHVSVTSCERLIGLTFGTFVVISLTFLDYMTSWPAIMSMWAVRIPEPSREIVVVSILWLMHVLHKDADNTGKSCRTSAGSDLKWLSCHCQWAPFREAKLEIDTK